MKIILESATASMVIGYLTALIYPTRQGIRMGWRLDQNMDQLCVMLIMWVMCRQNIYFNSLFVCFFI